MVIFRVQSYDKNGLNYEGNLATDSPIKLYCVVIGRTEIKIKRLKCMFVINWAQEYELTFTRLLFFPFETRVQKRLCPTCTKKSNEKKN